MRETTKNIHRPRRAVVKPLACFIIGSALGLPLVAFGEPPGPISPDLVPTTLEVWTRDVLAGVATVKQLPPAQLVTQENITFLLAWQKGEGGGVDGNCGTFNPLNTKNLIPELNGTPACKKAGESFATVNYPTYSDGVEAAAYTMTGKTIPCMEMNRCQTRMGEALTLGLSAEDLAHVLATPEEFGDDQACWACPGGAKYEAGIVTVIGRLKSDPAAYRARADKRLDGAAEFVPLPEEEMAAPKAEFDDSVPVTMTADGAFAFPLRVNAEDIVAGIDGAIKRDRAWCHASNTACHHDYPAADITVPTGTMVVAPEAGTIIAAAPLSGIHNEYVKIQHSANTCTLLLHMLPGSLMVGVGDAVVPGTPIGRVGTGEDAVAASTGSGTFPHLHFEATNCAGGQQGRQRMDPQEQLKYMFESLPHRGQLVLPPPPNPQPVEVKQMVLNVSAICHADSTDGKCLGTLGTRLARLSGDDSAPVPTISPDGALSVSSTDGTGKSSVATAAETALSLEDSAPGPPDFHPPPIGWKMYLIFLGLWAVACLALFVRDRRRFARMSRDQVMIVL